MKDHLRKCVTSVLLVCVVLNCCSCGTLMHPERKGQQSGRIDSKVAILDGIGLLFFLVPGVIAFAVDFSNGTIYLPPGQTSMLDPSEGTEHMIAVSLPEGPVTEELIEAAILEHTGKSVELSGPDVIVASEDSWPEAVQVAAN